MRRFLPKLALLAMLLFCCEQLNAQFTGNLAPCPNIGLQYMYTFANPMTDGTFTILQGPGNIEPASLGHSADGHSYWVYIKWNDAYQRNPDGSQVPCIIVFNGKSGSATFSDTLKNIYIKSIPKDWPAHINAPSLPASISCDFRGGIDFGIWASQIPNLKAASASVDAASGWTVTPIPNSSQAFHLQIPNGNPAFLTINVGSDCLTYSIIDTLDRFGPSVTYGGSISATGLTSQGFCKTTVLTLKAPSYGLATSYTWDADNSNILINGQHAPVTVVGVNDTSVTVQQDDITQDNYVATISVKPNIDPSLGCTEGGTKLEYSFRVGGYPIAAVPLVTFTSSRITITTANVSGALMYAWSMDGNIIGTTTVPRFQFNFTADCNSHEFQVFITKDCGTAPGVPYDMFICNNGGALAPNTVSPIAMDKISSDVATGGKTAAMKAFPNPATSKITVIVPATYLNGFIRVIDVHGVPVKALQANSNNVSIDISHLVPGVYVLSLEKGTLEKQTTKFVKQ